MTIRDLKLPQDLEELGTMLTDAFQYPENPDWGVQEDERDSLVEDLRSLRRNWWMVQIGQVFLPAMRDLLPGKVWLEDGRIAGMVLVQRRGSSDHWFVGTVATLPEYRRRGIARKLVQASLGLLREKGAEVVILDVIDANYPAYQLYISMGFEHFSGNVDLERPADGVYPEPEIPEEYRFEPVDILDWKLRFETMKKISPENIKQYEPVDPSLYRQPSYMRFILPLIFRAQKIKAQLNLIRHIPTGEPVGYIRFDARTGGKGRHTLAVRLDPAHAAISAEVLEFGLHQVTRANPDLMVESVLPAWQDHVVAAAENLGFEKRVQYHRMGVLI